MWSLDPSEPFTSDLETLSGKVPEKKQKEREREREREREKERDLIAEK